MPFFVRLGKLGERRAEDRGKHHGHDGLSGLVHLREQSAQLLHDSVLRVVLKGGGTVALTKTNSTEAHEESRKMRSGNLGRRSSHQGAVKGQQSICELT